MLDNLGNVLGGVAFLVVLVHLSAISACCTSPGAELVGRRAGGGGGEQAVAGGRSRDGAAALLAVMATFDLDDLSRRLEYAGQDVIYHGLSPYGSLVVTKSAGQLNFIENGAPLFSTQNVGTGEETVHYAMAQRPNARRVLLISGGVSGTLQEILKYPVETVDYVELDPLILEVARRYLPESLADPRIHLINTDGRLYVRQFGRGDRHHLCEHPTSRSGKWCRFRMTW